MESDKRGVWTTHNLFTSRPADRENDFHSLFFGLAFSGEKQVWVAEGDSGRVRLIDLASGSKRKTLELNAGDIKNSFSGALALDSERNFLYVLDQAHFRVAVYDTRGGALVTSVSVGFLPYALALSPDGRSLYVTNVGLFRYHALPGADEKRAGQTGLPFPAFGFPSDEASSGVARQNATGSVAVPRLGDPNVRESNSVCVIDVAHPEAAKTIGFVRTGLPFGPDNAGGSSPSGVLATADAVYVSNAHNDTVDVLDPATNTIRATVALRIPGLESLRGILPLGMAYEATRHWLLVAEAGINAVGVIDTRQNKVLGHLPVGWFPAAIAVRDGMVTVSNVKGNGTGPSTVLVAPDAQDFGGVLRRGSLSRFPLPGEGEFAKPTRLVLLANGFVPSADPPPPALPIRYVMIIVKENRTFDEVLGDMRVPGDQVNGIARLARFGMRGYAAGARKRFSLQNVEVTPNHHALAERFAFSDNFYADSDASVDGHHWIVGAYPDAWTESSLLAAYAGSKNFQLDDSAPGRLSFAGSNSSVHPEEQEEAGSLWQHLEQHHIPFRNFGEGFELAGNDESEGFEPTGARLLTNIPMPDALYRNTSRHYPGFNTNIPDQYRASQFIQEIETNYRKTGAPLPRLIFMHLPNDHTAEARPKDGYPYEASYVADNDVALGKIVEYLSHSPWWREMAIFITEDDAQSGRDHVDAHRTVFLSAGPYMKRNFVSHVNASFPSILKTAFWLLKLPPLNLFDAAAADLRDVFTAEPDFTPYTARTTDTRLFDPEEARVPEHPKPSAPMDAPP